MSHTLIPIDTGRSRPYLLEIRTHEVPMRGLPEALHGATFVHLSDFHGGYGDTEPVFEEVLRRLDAIRPDLLLFTGDYIDDHSHPHDYPMHEILRRFRAPLGVFGSFGNHEHRRGIVGSHRVLERSGIRLLQNESVCLDSGLWIAGVDDLFEGAPDIRRAFADLPEERTSIVLSHNPRLIDRVTDRNVLILSGHTHGGQIALPFPTAKMVCWFHLRCPQVAGWYCKGRARLYVSRGIGVTGKPFRYRCPAELGVFRMVPDPNDRRADATRPIHAEAGPEPARRR